MFYSSLFSIKNFKELESSLNTLADYVKSYWKIF